MDVVAFLTIAYGGAWGGTWFLVKAFEWWANLNSLDWMED